MFSMNALQPIHFTSLLSNPTLTAREIAILKRRHALHQKYEKAVALYADTERPLCEIAAECGFNAKALGNYLRHHWRELVLRRYKLSTEGKDARDVKIISAGKQSVTAHEKYKEAVMACDSMEFIELNVSQVARKFNLDGTALANFMRIHYEDIPIRREKIRRRLGLNDNIHRGARKTSIEQYAEAVELYRTTDMTIPQVAETCRGSEKGFSQFLRFYHKEILRQKMEVRKQAKNINRKVRGVQTGNGRKYETLPQTERKYAEALALYRDTTMTEKDIVAQTGVPPQGFRFYLHKWHKELVLERAGITGEISEDIDLRKARCRMKTVAHKYAEAIRRLKEELCPLTQIAVEFGFHPEAFRQYIHKYEPELAQYLGMKRNADDKLVSRASEEKYSEAVHLYETTTENLKSIA